MVNDEVCQNYSIFKVAIRSENKGEKFVFKYKLPTNNFIFVFFQLENNMKKFLLNSRTFHYYLGKASVHEMPFEPSENIQLPSLLSFKRCKCNRLIYMPLTTNSPAPKTMFSKNVVFHPVSQ